MTDLLDPLAGIPATPPPVVVESGQELAELWRTIIPWDDLNAKGPPDRYLKLGQEILPTLAILAAQGADKPHLLKMDAANRLLATANPNPIQRLTAAIVAGDQVITLDDTSPFPGGSHVFITSATVSLGTGPYLVFANTGNQLQLGRPVMAAFAAGDLVVGIPSYVAVGEDAQDRAVDFANTVAPAINAAAQIIFAANANHVWELAYLDATLRQTGATASAVAVNVWDGAVGTGAKIWTGILAVGTVVNMVDRISKDRLPIKTSLGNQLAVDIPAPGVTGILTLAAGAWVSNALR